MRRLALVIALLLAGCMDRYWTKAGGTQEGFYRDLGACRPHSGWCVRSPYFSGGSGCASEDLIRQCLREHGWVSAGRTHGLDGYDGPVPNLPHDSAPR